MKKHIDLRPAGITYLINMHFRILDIIFSKELFILIRLLMSYNTVSKRLGLVPQITVTLVLINFSIRITVQIYEPPGVDRKKLKALLKFFTPTHVADLLYSGQTVTNKNF